MATVHSTDPAAPAPHPANSLTDAELEQDHSLEIAIHLGTAKAIADIIHICTGAAVDGSESRLDELNVQTLPALVCAIEQHIEEAEKLQEKEDEQIGALRRLRELVGAEVTP